MFKDHVQYWRLPTVEGELIRCAAPGTPLQNAAARSCLAQLRGARQHVLIADENEATCTSVFQLIADDAYKCP